MEKVGELEEAVKWLFAQGFVHGDLLPGNVMFDTEKRKLVLIDFGRLTPPDSPADLQLELAVLDQEVTSWARSLLEEGSGASSAHAKDSQAVAD
jgi:aminoglycoside phosphotransferase (APT) family kinase protein